ncbi:hypothetical protein MMC22_004833 [Lobaria immixta]|nr:hypothetical protein [Lobaria immixta]
MAPKHQLLRNDSSDFDPETPARKKRAPKVVQPAQKAEVTMLAADPKTENQNSTAKPAVEERILERIRKCLTKANHPGTPEAEAKAAFRMGSILMSQHNITQAQAFEKEKEEDQARLGGESLVAITTAKHDKKVINYAFTGSLAQAMTIFFDCKCYSTARRSATTWTFYGIATNTAAAAMSFEMAYNLTLDWASSKRGGSPRHSYCLGVAEGLIKIAKTEKADENEKAKESEMSKILAAENLAQNQRAKEIDRLEYQDPEEEEKNNVSDRDSDFGDDALENADSENIKVEEEGGTRFETGADFEDVEEEEERRDGTDFPGDFKTELEKTQTGETTPSIQTWESEMQLTLFRAKAEGIADEYLKSNNVKLHRGRKSTAAKDYAAYKQGKKDSRNVDVRRKRLEAASMEI